MLKIGIIGNGVHSKRIQKILKKKNYKFLIYKPNSKNYFDKEKYKELKKQNVIFIVTPNKSHFKYLKDLKKNRYIFCEKPPVSTKKEIEQLKRYNLKKIYFNYNFRYSTLSKFLMESKKYNLGQLINGKIIIGHGLAFKKEYVKNWRSSKIKCPKGVFETVSIHWVDLINYIFGIKKQNSKLLNLSGNGDSFDTSYTDIFCNSGAKIEILTTYCSPLVSKKIFIFSNGIIEQNDNILEIRGPAKNFSKNGNFIRPKLIKKVNLNDQQDYLSSLERSIDIFIKKVNKNFFFDKNESKCSILSNEIILN